MHPLVVPPRAAAVARALIRACLLPSTAENVCGIRSAIRTVAQYGTVIPVSVGGVPVPEATVTFCLPPEVTANPLVCAYRQALCWLVVGGLGTGLGQAVGVERQTTPPVPQVIAQGDAAAAALAMASAADSAAACATWRR